MSLDLPFDFYRVPGRARRLQSLPFALPPSDNDTSSAFSPRVLGVPDPVLTAAFGILLARYNGQPTILLSLCRASATTEHGSTQMFALDVDPTRTGREALEQTRDLSHVRGQGSAPPMLGSTQDAAGGRAAIIWLESQSDAETCTVDALVALEHSSARGADADLSLVIGPGAGSRAAFVYDSSLFRQSSIERFAGHLGVLLSSLSSSPDTLVSDLPLLLPAEQRWVESVCNGPAATVPTALVHELFSLQAAAAPEAIALRFRDQLLSYGELNRRANQLARYLADRNIGADCAVVVCVEPAFDIVVALLGILKAGAIYVPLDPTYPPARIRAILDDTRPELVITQHHLRARLELGREAVLVLDDLAVASGSSPDEDPQATVEPGQIASIYYTSGTTGSPKGVMASQANLRHYIRTAQQRYQIDNRDVMPAIARFSFSISMFELLLPLVAGGTLILLEREHILDPGRMARTLGEVTIFHAGPSLLKGLVAYIRSHYQTFADFSGVRHASSGGDMVPPELLEGLKQIFANAEVFVIYGSSEISCMGCTYPVPRDRRVKTTYVGKPFDNVVVRVLDGSQNLLPVGIVGEIHFAGDGVTVGYLNRPELTTEKFVMLGSQRYYRTGDRGRLSKDGWLEILGRNDFQVKLRGMRVELGEVESHLRGAPGVRDAVVMARAAADADKMLVAYIVIEQNGAPAQKSACIAAIRRHMRTHLPDYMVPAVYVELERLPVNHNMKLDRLALPEPNESDLRALSGASVREPQSATEKTLASIWQKLLGLREVGIDDNFFELGGHSMLAVMLSLEVERALGVPLEGMDILREPLGVLAAICDRRLGAPSPSADTRKPASRAAEPREIFHFGEGNSLYGVLHGSRRGALDAALICGPVGQEQVRTGFVLSRLAKQLARDGVPTLTFDYFGCGDSLGDSVDANVGRWQADIAQAHAELRRRTNGARVTAIGVRLGALLLCQVAPELKIEKLLLWDPVHDGAAHGAELVAMQRSYLRSVAHLGFWRRQRRARRPATELLGTTYSDAAFRELKALTLAPLLLEQHPSIRSLLTAQPTRHGAHSLPNEASGNYPDEWLDVDCGWRDIARLEDVIPDTAISSTLAALVREGR
jgi:amino acid adenylation domain-containing protein